MKTIAHILRIIIFTTVVSIAFSLAHARAAECTDLDTARAAARVSALQEFGDLPAETLLLGKDADPIIASALLSAQEKGLAKEFLIELAGADRVLVMIPHGKETMVIFAKESCVVGSGLLPTEVMRKFLTSLGQSHT